MIFERFWPVLAILDRPDASTEHLCAETLNAELAGLAHSEVRTEWLSVADAPEGLPLEMAPGVPATAVIRAWAHLVPPG